MPQSLRIDYFCKVKSYKADRDEVKGKQIEAAHALSAAGFIYFSTVAVAISVMAGIKFVSSATRDRRFMSFVVSPAAEIFPLIG